MGIVVMAKTLAEFFSNKTSREERERVMLEVARRASEAQRKVMAEAQKLREEEANAKHD